MDPRKTELGISFHALYDWFTGGCDDPDFRELLVSHEFPVLFDHSGVVDSQVEEDGHHVARPGPHRLDRFVVILVVGNLEFDIPFKDSFVPPGGF